MINSEGFSNEENNDSTSSNSHGDMGCISIAGGVACIMNCSSDEDAGATSLLDSPLSGLGEELGSDDHGDLGEVALAEDLEIALEE
jgi:hypothetical protein